MTEAVRRPGQLRILIAEDDAVSRKILHRAVERFGHQCICARDGNEAWEIFKRSPELDVVISDWAMPGSDGIELCRRIRAFSGRRDANPYFVFTTAFVDKDHYLIGMQVGADDYLTKPLDLDELRARLIAMERVISLQKRLLRQKKALELVNRKLFKEARQDPLTRLGNRLRLREDLETLSAQAQRYGHSYCAMLCDVDFFKQYNDTYGHLAGDEVLKKMAGVISENLRAGDMAYRYGGEEFLVILPEQDLKSATVVAKHLLRSLEDLAIPHGAKMPPGVVTISVGLAALPPGEKKPIENLLKEADAALYGAKEAGRNRVEVYMKDGAGT
jgi:two-component system cell cycle response regulator